MQKMTTCYMLDRNSEIALNISFITDDGHFLHKQERNKEIGQIDIRPKVQLIIG